MIVCLALQSAQKIFGGEVKNHLLMFVSKKSDKFQPLQDDYKVAAKMFQGKVSFILIY